MEAKEGEGGVAAASKTSIVMRDNVIVEKI